VRPGAYPRDAAEWGLPSGLEAALQWDNGQTYFFKDGLYWRFNDRLFAVDRALPPFPRNTGQWWFGCPRVSPLGEAEGGSAAAVALSPDGRLKESGTKGEEHAAASDSVRDAGDEDLDASSD